jgi:predicted transcriptional regulator
MEVCNMIPEYTASITIRVPDDIRSRLESMSLKEDKPLSRIVRSVIVDGLKQKMASDDDFIELEA